MQDNQEAILTFPVQHSVFLSPDQSEIEQIDEIELTPHIQIKETADEVIVSGYLKLEGKYAGKPPKFPDISLDDNEVKVTGYVDSVVFNPFAVDPDDFEDTSEFTSFMEKIPVHIRIARSKIEDVEQIYASIVSFDYDIQSARKLGVFAELALNGVKSEVFTNSSAEQSSEIPLSFEYAASRKEEEQEEEREEATESNEAPESDEARLEETEEEAVKEQEPVEEAEVQPEIEPVAFEQPQESEEQKETPAPIQETPASIQEIQTNKDEDKVQAAKIEEENPVSIQEIRGEEDEAQVQTARVEDAPVPVQEVTAESQPAREKGTTVDEGQAQIEDTAELEAEREAASFEAEEGDAVPAEEEGTEPEAEKGGAKVSITLKGTKRDPVTVTTSLLSSYAQREEKTEADPVDIKRVEEIQEEEPARSEEPEKAEISRKEGALYLTSFMKQDAEKFTRLKMCITQQDETLDGIAEKYSVSPADIAAANGLHTNATVAKGQVLYIPVKS